MNKKQNIKNEIKNSEGPKPDIPTIEEVDVLIGRLYSCAFAHMSRYNKSPCSENWHPTHQEIYNQTLDFQNRRLLAKKN